MPVTGVTGSSESTVRTVLFSGLRDSGDEFDPRWELKVPIKHPPGNVGFVTLEELHYSVPSVMDIHNQFGTFQINFGNVFEDRTARLFQIYNIYKNADLTSSITIYNLLHDLQRAFNRRDHTDEIVRQVAVPDPNNPGNDIDVDAQDEYGRPIYDKDPNIVGNIQWENYVGLYSPFHRDYIMYSNTVGPARLRWPNPLGFSTYDGYLTELTNNTFAQQNDSADAFIKACRDSYTIKIKVEFAPTASVIMSGNLVKFFNLSPKETYTFDEDTGMHCSLATRGVNMLKVHCNIGRSVMASSLTNIGLAPSNVLWVINATEDQNQLAWYYNNGLGATLPFVTSSVDEINIYFTDEWNTKLQTITNFTALLGFDYKEKETPKPTSSLKRARVAKPSVESTAQQFKNIPYSAITR